eukprot:scaffold193_cov139-Amphora_coffeaeformis.AAC.1
MGAALYWSEAVWCEILMDSSDSSKKRGKGRAAVLWQGVPIIYIPLILEFAIVYLSESSRKKIHQKRHPSICVDTVLSLPPCFRSTRKGEEGRFVQGPGRGFVYREEEVVCGRGKSFEGTSSGRWFVRLVRLVQLRVASCGHVET